MGTMGLPSRARKPKMEFPAREIPASRIAMSRTGSPRCYIDPEVPIVDRATKYATCALRVGQRPCARCGAAVEQNACCCPLCREFFRNLSGSKSNARA
jgi:hypothetical protein